MANWFRSWHGAPTDIKWISVARDAGTTPAHVIAVVWALLDHASQESDRGDIHNFKPRDFAAFSGIDEMEIERILSALLRNGVTDNNRFVAWEKRQPNTEDRTNAERQRRFRERKAVENKQKSKTKENVTALRNGCNDRVEESREDKKELSNDSSKKKRNNPFAVLRDALGDELAMDVVDHRKAIRKPMTDRAARELLANFERYGDPQAAARAMIANGWQGFNADWLRRQQAPPNKRTFDDVMREMESGNERQQEKITGGDVIDLSAARWGG